MIIRLDLNGQAWPDEVPFPGTLTAQEVGCTCPEDQQLPYIEIDVECLVHELEKVEKH